MLPLKKVVDKFKQRKPNTVYHVEPEEVRTKVGIKFAKS